jgi:hypothetical protein
MTAVLEGLDHVNWSRLGHAYGPADDIPGQIRALRSADAQERKTAVWELYGNIFHQGTRYEATPHAVPFLLEVVAAPDTVVRAQVLGLLASVAIGYDETWLPDGIPVAQFREAAQGGEALLAAAPHPGDEDFDEDEGDYAYLESLSEADRNRLHAYVELAAYDAVRSGVYMFRELLSDADADVRQAAAYTLAWFPEAAAGSLPGLDALIGDAEPVAATALIAMGLLGGSIDEQCLRDERPVVRWAAAIAMARTRGDDLPAAAVTELLTWAGTTSDAGVPVPFFDGDAAGYAAMALGRLAPHHLAATFDALMARIPSVSGTQAVTTVGEALHIAFPDGPIADADSFAELDERQRRLLRCLADAPEAWQLDGMIFANFGALMRSYGLPRDRATLAEFVNAAERA